ncbi:uncharacterized protein [Callorhinus ursinus]|uniref:uncharacterized protein n=1 Tax=Callorhinus ursinus TaxID=34884 RepID=UPI003CD00C5B
MRLQSSQEMKIQNQNVTIRANVMPQPRGLSLPPQAQPRPGEGQAGLGFALHKMVGRQERCVDGKGVRGSASRVVQGRYPGTLGEVFGRRTGRGRRPGGRRAGGGRGGEQERGLGRCSRGPLPAVPPRCPLPLASSGSPAAAAGGAAGGAAAVQPLSRGRGAAGPSAGTASLRKTGSALFTAESPVPRECLVARCSYGMMAGWRSREELMLAA